ncbi:MAG: prepilin-type N-terminal cleavage/methylation domain-containing protein [Planctomycetaceae bacterium]|nr:prepilin-type N-terminal cleavage/methylation domain-containing protein [Planctomycetaceae bacterium]
MAEKQATARRGLTLTELLVVVSIMVIVAGALVPMVQPLLKGRNPREAARQLNVMMAGAQARAMATGRSAGIWLERAAHEPNDPPELWYSVYKVYLAEEPVPYSGDFDDSRVAITQANSGVWQANFLPDISCCQSAATLVQIGDFIRLNQRGPRYPIVGMDTTKISFTVPPQTPRPMTPARYLNSTTGTTFEIFRQPIKSASSPIEMPNNTAIDLSVSGFADLNTGTPSLTKFREMSPEYDIAIMFSPDGGIDHIFFISHEPNIPTFAVRPASNISLLIGRSDKVGRDLQKATNITNDAAQNVTGPMGLASLEEKANIWLTIASHSGRVSSAENAGISLATMNTILANPGAFDARSLIGECRQYADTGQSMGGR